MCVDSCQGSQSYFNIQENDSVKCTDTCPYPLAPVYNSIQRTGFTPDYGFPAAVCLELSKIICNHGVLVQSYNPLYLKNGITQVEPTPLSYICNETCGDELSTVKKMMD